MLFFLATGLFSCAQEGAPPGGPPDRFPPVIVETTPPSGTTRVPVTVAPVITFNERVDLPSLESSIFIAPLLSFQLKANWGGNRITLHFYQPLAPAQTYVITIGTGTRDTRGNRMARSAVLALSTGEKIDAGEITGAVALDAGKAIGAFIWAYNLRRHPAPNPETIPPDYIVQAGKDGRFAFSNLSPGRYRLFAFLDRGRNSRYDAGTDPLGLPTGDVTLTEAQSRVEHRRMQLAVRDTASLVLFSVRPANAYRLLLRFNKPVEAGTLADTSRYRIVRRDGTVLPVRAAYRTPTDSSSVSLVTGRMARKDYVLTVTGLLDTHGHALAADGESASFSGSASPDRRPPHLLRSVPADSTRHVPLSISPALIFSEAVEADSGAIALIDTAGRRVEGTLHWESPVRARFRPDSILQPDTAYHIDLIRPRIRDGAGNPLEAEAAEEDTITVRFTTVDPEFYGMISGAVTDDDTTAEGAIHLRLRDVDTPSSRYETMIPAPGPYIFDKVLPGSYTISAYRDLDGDGRLGLGRIAPFLPAERTTARTDTIGVRSGWESEGMDLRFWR